MCSWSSGAVPAWLFVIVAALAPSAALADAEADKRRLEAANIRLVSAGASFSDLEIHELVQGLQSLPAPLRQFPGGPLELARRAERSPFGMGDGSGERPDWSDGRARFHLYEVDEPAHEERAALRLEKLSADDRVRLWRRRAVVHAVLQRWDEALGWSSSPAWKAISGWHATSFVTGPLNAYAGAFSRDRGRQSAALDLLTFAEEALVPPTHLRPDAVPIDDAVQCQEFSRWRALDAALRQVGGALPARGGCPAFDAWANPQTLSHFEMLFADPSAAHPESVFGHLLIRIVRNVRLPPAYQELFEVAAVTDSQDGAATFVLKGIAGGYVTAFGRTSMTTIRHRYLETDQRSLRRFRLQLTDDEQVRLLERMWELERRGYLPYTFFSENCAALLLFVLDPVLDGGAPQVPTPWKAPSDVLEQLAKADRPRPLLVLLPDRLESDLDQALRAEPQSRDAEQAFLRAVHAGPDLAAWEAVVRDLRAADAARRAAAYRRLLPLLQRTPDSARLPLAALLDAQLALERYGADRARQVERNIDSARILRDQVAAPNADEVIRARQSSYAREVPGRTLSELRRVIALEELWAKAPRRPLTTAEQGALAKAKEAQAAYTSLAITLARARASKLLPPPRAEPAASNDVPAQMQPPANRGYGHLRLQVGGEAHADAAGVRPALRLRFAALAEHLGDERDRGFSPRSELRFLDAEIVFDRYRGAADLVSADVELFRFRTTSREPELLQKGLFSAAGRGVGLTYRRRRAGLSRDALTLHGAIYVPVGGRDGSAGRASIFGMGAGISGRLRASGSPVTAGPRAEWVERVPLGAERRTALRIEALWEGGLIPLSAIEHRAGATAVVEHPLRVFGIDALVSPMVRVDWEGHARESIVRASAGLVLEKL